MGIVTRSGSGIPLGGNSSTKDFTANSGSVLRISEQTLRVCDLGV